MAYPLLNPECAVGCSPKEVTVGSSLKIHQLLANSRQECAQTTLSKQLLSKDGFHQDPPLSPRHAIAFLYVLWLMDAWTIHG